MTSQHFDDGWDNWGEDWGTNPNESNNNNNSQQLSQQPNQQYVQQQQPPQIPSNAPLYSPFPYQSQPTNVSHAQTMHTPQQPPQLQNQQQNPFAKAPNQSRPHQKQQYAANPVNFFNPTSFSDANANNQYPTSQPPTFSFVQSPIPSSTVTTSMNPSNPQNVQFETVNKFQYQESVPQNQFTAQPPQANVSYSNDQSSAHQTMPTSQPMIYSNVNQPRNVATPPTLMQNYDTNFNSTTATTQQQHSGYQYSQWNDQRSHSNESASWQSQQSVPMTQNSFNANQQQMPPVVNQPQMTINSNQPQMTVSTNQTQMNVSSNQPPQMTVSTNQSQMPPMSSDWQNLQAPQASYFPSHFEAPVMDERSTVQEQKVPEQQIPQIPTTNQFFQPNFDNLENIQASSIESAPVSNLPPLPSSIPQMPPLPPTSNAAQQSKNPINEIPYPENRERLDDSVPTSQNNPIMPITTTSIDRHNYLVTGQLAQEVPTFSQHPVMHESFNENLPPPGLSRMVVGEPESNQQQIQAGQNDLLPPRSNRMVTGTEMTPTSFMNYQRQADGEVSQEPSMQRQLPPFNVPQQQQIPQQQERIAEDGNQSQNFNISDRNLYLVAGESDANSQRVITGVESDNNAPSLINPLQNLHIEDDEDFVNISVTQMPRNVDGDGMEEQNLHLQNQIQHALDSSQQREEEIEGANDNNNELNANVQPVIEIPSIPASINLSEQNSDIREDIEGANDLSDPPKPQPVEFEEKRKSIDSGMRTNQKVNTTMSSEDSELRELEKNMKQKSRRSNKKYDSDNDSESASLDDYKKDKSRDDRYSKKNRDRVREELERYKKREKERRSGGRRRNDDTDGSRYGESRRRTDDEDDDRRRNRNRREKRNDDEVEDDDKEKDRKDRRYRDSRDSRRKDYDYDDRRGNRRRREKYYDDEVYPSGRRSHNASDREYERDYRPGRSSRGPYEMQGYYQQPSYPYDPNYYYQQQQQQYSDKLQAWLEQIRLTNPQAYEWYKNYYSGILQKSQMPLQPTMDDIGGSLRSGYNSGSERASTSRFMSGGIVTNPLGSLNSSFIDNTNDYQSLQQPYQTIGKDYNQAYSSLNNFNKYDMYGDLRAKQPEVAAARMTPQKFQCLHGFVRLSNGLMITIDTLNADEKYLVKVDNVPIYDKTRRLYQSYPGPLIRGVSHKKTVIEFCEEKLKQSSHLDSIQRASYALLWSYLILMIRQNGSYTEHDIAELLMKNSEEYRAYDLDDNKSSANINNNNEIDDDENATDVSESEENDASEHHSNSASHQQQTSSQSISASLMTEQVVLDKFKSYLLYGNIHDALDYATDNNLWGHALFLASKVDRRQHANVMLKFANKLSYNDPLQTLYQIMSGRMPACVTNFDEKWGDWRPHLAMIISNCTDKPDLVKRSILALGDTLASRGDIFGSQFCYLLIDPQFTDYSDTGLINGKIGLLGTSVHMSFKDFATNDSIIMTEVYEYARSLNTENYFIASLQKYKFLLATNMLDYGLKLKCLLYMEQISKCIIQQSSLFDTSFISKVYSLADRLKFYDPVMEKLYEDINNVEGTEDQQWLQDLANVLQNETGSSFSQQYIPADVQTEVYNPPDYTQSQTIPQSSPIYDPVSQHQTPTHVPTIPTQNHEEHDSSQQIYNYEQQNQVPVTTYDQNMGFNNQYQYQDQQSMQNYSNYNQNAGMQNDGQNNEQQQNQQQGYLQPQQTYDANASMGGYQQSQNDYGYGWDQPKGTITMGTAVSHKFDDPQPQDKSDSSANKQEDKKSPAKKPEPEKNKKQAPASGGSGWFSSLFRLGKAPNQMILPDDKNPAIVWDEATKKWVNKDGDEAESESFKPPPKMGEMGMSQPQQMQNIQQNMPQQFNQQSMPQQQVSPQQQSIPQQQFAPQMQQNVMNQQPMMNQAPIQNHVAQMPQQPQQANQNAVDQAAPSVPSAPNMFKMQKGRNLKKSYVDILGNAGKTVSQPKELAPQMDMQFFNPAAQPQAMNFYNPNDFQ